MGIPVFKVPGLQAAHLEFRTEAEKAAGTAVREATGKTTVAGELEAGSRDNNDKFKYPEAEDV